jgi:uncharacterized cupin superfamily protein
MAAFMTYDEERSRAFLSVAGVRILNVEDPDVMEVMAEVLGEETQERARLVAEPPADAEASESGMGAWHVNNGDEFQTVVSGRGIVEFITDKGPVAVVMEAGDIMVIEQAEHRYRPLTNQEWIIRFCGQDLVATDTGRASGPWPVP